MKINISIADFREAVGRAASVIGNTSELPVLSNLLLEAGDNQLTLLGTNTNQFLRTRVPCEVIKAGSICLPATWLTSAARTMNGDRLCLETNDSLRATMSVPGNVQKQQGLAAKEFLPLPELDTSSQWSMPQAEMAYALARVAPAQNDDRTSDILCGMLLSGDGNEVRFVATNRRILACVTEQLTGVVCELVIPLDCVNLLTKTLGDDGTVSVRVGKNQIAFEVGDTLLVSKLLEGTFPNYRQVIPRPENYQGGVGVERKAFRLAFSTIEPASRTNGATALSVATFGGDKLKLRAENDNAEAEYELPLENAGDLHIGLDPNKVLRILSGLNDEYVQLDWCGPNDGLTFAADNFLGVVMPIRLQPA